MCIGLVLRLPSEAAAPPPAAASPEPEGEVDTGAEPHRAMQPCRDVGADLSRLTEPASGTFPGPHPLRPPWTS